ncbi:hypothetical protein FALBO_7482 [Fusarium albosuccineum]|uniref:L-serine dehydratase n=1 Tax=Fusarium albosuccineum TaxID=1237068 RepID=A0A8H4LDS2_9HYPO|nr:hypothetical protein FALBO_7482 [Fusarium albosuccineum]
MSRAGMQQLSLLRTSRQRMSTSTRSLAAARRWPIGRPRAIPAVLNAPRLRHLSTTTPRRLNSQDEEDTGSYSEADHEHAVISTFDLFSIGIGPSSSHTVGPMRAGNIFVNDLVEANLLHRVNKIRVSIYGSLALTGEGHMTPSALLLGLEGADVETVETAYVPTRFTEIKDSKKIHLGRWLSPDGSKGKEITFDYDREFVWEWGRKLPLHSNGMRFTVYDNEGYVLATNDMFSVGGGFVVNGSLSIAPEETLSTNAPAQLEAGDSEPAAPHPADLAENMYYKEIRRSDAAGDRKTGTEVKPLEEATVEAGAALLGDESASRPNMDVATDVKPESKSTSSSPHPRYPFRDAASLLSLCRKHNLTIAQLVYENEKSLGHTDEDIFRKLFKIWRVMDASILESVQAPAGSKLPGSLKLHRRAPGLYQRLTRGLYPSSASDTTAARLESKFSAADTDQIDQGTTSALSEGSSSLVPQQVKAGGLRKRSPPRIHGSLDHPIAPSPSRRTTFPTMDYLAVYAIAVNETNAGGGRIVTAPTNGAAGIIPAVLKYTTEFISDDPERDIPTFLLTAAAIGMLYKRGATISAAEGGCMAEVGVACSMAAGAFAACMGASPETIEQAAEIGIEHNLGLTCDPIGGLVQAPCIERNALGATKAISSANLALSSETGTQRVRLDDAIRAMRLTAKGMRNEFKETSLSGLATSVHINIPSNSNFTQLPSMDHITNSPEETDSNDRTQACRCCLDLDASRLDENKNHDFKIDAKAGMASRRIDVRQVIDSSQRGCQSCFFIHKALEFFGLRPPGVDGYGRRDTLVLNLPVSQGNPEIAFHSTGLKSYLFLQLYNSSDEGETWRQIRHLPDICADHLSPQGLSFMSACLRTCIDRHPLCRQSEDWVPTRLLYIGATGDNQVQLIETDQGLSERYIALSYCWGDKPTIKTLTENLDDMVSGIPFSALPSTYLDAIVLARELGIKYLWIDALCIIQDSQTDWERECSMMADVYSNAYLTIAAASSMSATQHFLQPFLGTEQDVAHPYRKTFSQKVDDGYGEVLLKARVISQTGVHWRWQVGNDEQAAFEPITRRGWTLQEKLLSTRFLSISATEMSWSCKEAVFCECTSKLNHQRSLQVWHKVVESYSKRALSKPTDKLPAISAIAARVQQRIGSEYVAGLWKDNIDNDLLWQRIAPIRESQPEYVAPSFSWASMDGEVDYFCFRNGRQPYHKTSTVLHVEAQARLEAPLSHVEGGRLDVRGPLSLGVIQGFSNEGLLTFRLGTMYFQVEADTLLQTLTTPGTEGRPRMSACRRNPHGSGKSLSDQLVECPDEIQCWVLRLGSFSVAAKPAQQGFRYFQLLVLGKSPTRGGAYERIGLASWGHQNNNELSSVETVTSITIV